jgi:aromatic-L-amino-acid/L-tryptophan decarboxylase
MLDEIQKYRELMSPLEPEATQRAEITGKMLEYTEQFLHEIYHLPTYVQCNGSPDDLHDFNILDEGTGFSKLLDIISEKVDTPGINPASGGHLAFIPGGGLFASAVGDWFAAIMNKYSGVYFAAPGAVRLENHLISWLADLVGYPAEASGNLTSGGSVSNQIGIVTAREAMDLKARDFERSVIYLSEQAHHSIRKSVKTAGMKECPVRYIPLDENYRMIPSEFEKQIAKDRAEGLNPFLLASAAGTTDTGAVDPIGELGDICRAYNIWHHIDGAYGAFFVLSDLVKDKLTGLAKSDSLVMDPHKGLFLPYGSGAVLVRDREKLLDAHFHTANYMQDAHSRQEEAAPADLSPEMSRHFRGLRMWLPLRLAGLNTFRAALNEKILLARYFYEKIQEIDGFEVGNYPDLSVVTYRYVPKYGDANAFNARLIEEFLKDGRVFLSSTMLNGNFTLRMVALHFRTHIETIDLALEMLKEKVKIVEGE